MFQQAKKVLLAVTTLVTFVTVATVDPSTARAEKKRSRGPTATRAAESKDGKDSKDSKDHRDAKSGKRRKTPAPGTDDKSDTSKTEASDAAATELTEVKPESTETAGAASTSRPKDTSKPEEASESKEAREAREAKEAKRRGEGFTRAVDKIAPSVVQVRTTSTSGKETSGPAGSGVLVSSDGTIVTSNRLVEHAAALEVRVKDGRIVKATLVGRDPMTDLAVLKIDTTGLTGLVPAKLGSGVAKVGSWVVRVAATGDGRAASAGILGSRGHDGLGASGNDDFASLDTSPGASTAGAPVVDEDGDLLGISMHPAARSASTTLVVNGALAKKVIDQITAKGHVTRGWHGIGAQDLSAQVAGELGVPAGEGALVNAIAVDSPGARGNLRPGDVIVSVDGSSIHSAHALQRGLVDAEPGKSVAIEVLRGGKRYGASVTLGTAKSTPAATPSQGAPKKDDGFGMTLADQHGDTAKKHGLTAGTICQVTGVNAGSVAERSGLRVGDLILEADGKIRPGASAIETAASDNHLLLRVRRGDSVVYVALAR